MAIRRLVATDFWTDDKVVDRFSPEDKYFMLYLLTNPHTTQLGIYKLNIKYAAFETGYSVETIRSLIDRFENHLDIIYYSHETGEIAIKNYLIHSIIKGGKPVADLLWKEINDVNNKELVTKVFEHIKDSDKINQTVRNIIDTYTTNNINEIHNENEIHNDIHNENDKSYPLSYHDSSDDSLCESLKEHSEPKKASESVPQEQTQHPIITITLNTKEEYPIYQKDINEWKELYPSVDIMQELRNMKGWCNDKPERRKTKRGIRRFIGGWLSRKQDESWKNVQRNNNSYSKNQFNNYQQSVSSQEIDDFEKMFLQEVNERSGS